MQEEKNSPMRPSICAAAMLSLFAIAGGTDAEEHVVQMLNKGENGAIAFQPDLIQAAPGDTIKSVPTDKSYNAENQDASPI